MQCQSVQTQTDDSQRAAALARETDKMYAQLQARWNAEAGISADPSRQTLNALTSAQPATNWGGVGNGGLASTLQSLAASLQHGGLQQQQSPFTSSSSPFSSPFAPAAPSSLALSFQQSPSIFTSPLQTFSSFNAASRSASSSQGAVAPQISALRSKPPVILPISGASLPPGGNVLLPTALASLPLLPPLTKAPSVRPRANVTKAPTAPVMPFTTSDAMNRAKDNYLKRFPKVSSTTQQLSILDFFVQFGKQDFKQTALHFASGSKYESNGVTYVADLSEPASWTRFPVKTRSKCRFAPKSPSVMWVTCTASSQSQETSESMTVTFDPAGFITTFSNLEPKTCS